MNKSIAIGICLIILLLPLSFADEKMEVKYEVTNVKSFLNIRSGPGTIYSILRAIPNTEKNITIVESKQLAKSTWVKIKHNNEYGWVNNVYLKSMQKDAPKKLHQHKHKYSHNHENHEHKEVNSNKNEKKNQLEEQPSSPLWSTMSGVYSLTNVSPMKGEDMNTHMLFQLEEKQAKILYDAIKTPEFTDKCTGAMAKKTGEMVCLHYLPQQKNNNKEKTNDERKEFYECHFSINIMEQKIQQGILCGQ